MKNKKVEGLKFKIKKGDKVKVMAGKDKGREGAVEKVFYKKGQVLVAGVNMFKKHARAQEGKSGGIIDITKPLPIAKVALICTQCGQSTRVGTGADKDKKRICKKCKGLI